MGENPIAVRSKKRLTTALSELIETKQYHDITITELCAQAKLSRPAFYQNFNSKDEILNRLIRERIVAAIEDAGIPSEPTLRDALRQSLDIAALEVDLWNKAFSSGCAMNVKEQLAWAIAAHLLPKGSSAYRDAYLAGGIAAAVVTWAAEGMEVDRGEFEELLVSPS